jgi:ketosteroid isomerase-like protein
MSKTAIVASLVIAGVALAAAQAPAPAPSAKSPGVPQAIKQLEHDWIDAERTGDAARLSQILADDWIGIGYDGKKERKQEMLADVKSGKGKVDSFEYGPVDVKVLGNVAVFQGSDTEKSSFDGKDTSGKYAWMDVFVKREGKWVAVRSQIAMVK